MAENVCDDTVPDMKTPENISPEERPSPAGTFPLRRAHYFQHEKPLPDTHQEAQSLPSAAEKHNGNT